MSRHLCRYRKTMLALLSFLRRDKRNLEHMVMTTREPAWLVKDARIRLSLTDKILHLIPVILKEQI